jgi:hypothetical protein
MVPRCVEQWFQEVEVFSKSVSPSETKVPSIRVPLPEIGKEDKGSST